MSFDLDEDDLKESKSFDKHNYFDWYDDEQVEKLQEKIALQYLRLWQKVKEAEASGDKKVLEKAKVAFRKHLQKEAKMKTKAKEAGYCWM